MPAKLRAAKERHPSFSAEVLALFAEIERMPKRGQNFTDRSHELARMLGLTAEWWRQFRARPQRRPPPHVAGI
jgi:hypothetical protein